MCHEVVLLHRETGHICRVYVPHDVADDARTDRAEHRGFDGFVEIFDDWNFLNFGIF